MSESTNRQAAEAARKSRRDFLRFSALGLAVPVVGTALAACGEEAAQGAQAPATVAATRDSDDSGGTIAPHPKSPAEIRAAADEMDRHHEAGVKAFPAKTEGKGNQPFEPRIENGVKVFEVTAEVIQWETEPGKRVEAWAYNRQVPGPQIRVKESDRVRLVLHNQLPESTAVHFHGLELPNDQDGVPFITQPPVKPGESWPTSSRCPKGTRARTCTTRTTTRRGRWATGCWAPSSWSRRARARSSGWTWTT